MGSLRIIFFWIFFTCLILIVYKEWENALGGELFLLLQNETPYYTSIKIFRYTMHGVRWVGIKILTDAKINLYGCLKKVCFLDGFR